MAPSPQQHWPRLSSEKQDETPAPVHLTDESVVISGMSGLFPMSNSVADLSKILYNKVNPVNSHDLRWTQRHPEAPDYLGKVPELELFDSQFFMVHKRLGEAMDPMARKILEHAFQAIYDAGISPKHLNGKKVGVYVASAFSDTEKNFVVPKLSNMGYGITGGSKTMFANRISYWLNAKGPSMTIDDASCGSIVALEQAFNAIKNGSIESAIVGGAYTCLASHSLVHYNRCIKLSQDGKTKSFDQNANGCAPGEAISVLFIQKAKDAKRAYAEVVHVKNEFISRLHRETGQIIGFTRNPDNTAEFLQKFYEEAHVSPNDVEYIEAYGSAIPEADKTELQCIEKVFCNNRSDSLLVGSVMSNIGFTDAASGITGLTKVLLGYHHSLIASNLHCETPRQDIPAIKDGRISIVTDHKPFRGTYAAVNCLSYCGVNSHVLLRGCSKPKDLNRYKSSIPRLLTISARQQEYLQDIFESLKLQPIDAEELALLQNIHSTNISGHLGRGYIILDTNLEGKTVSLSEKMDYSDDTNRPLWFVYSGMGSQWAGMGAQLMRIPVFAAAIERCRKILEPQGIDILHIITTPDKTIFDNVLNSFVGIAAIQIGITDVLTTLGIRPDKIIGHSVGELGCAYADGCLTAEEMILSAASRGKASNDAKLIKGAMAAVGVGYQQISKLCPPSIDIACHNSSSSCTISGPVEAIRGFVALLTANGVFAREVPSANIAYHSRYIASAGPYLLNLLDGIIKEPKLRSDRWVSTSVPQERWNEPAAKYCSAEYLTNNLLQSVLFEETSSLIPSNAVLVEIAPHGLLQAILKRALPDTCTNIPVTQRGHKDSVQFLLEAIGNLYIAGFSPQVQEIYPKVEFPVSTKTRHLGQYVKWFHTETWNVIDGEHITKTASSRPVLISVHDDEHNYLSGNVVQGKTLFPFTGALVAVWDTLAMTLGLPKKEVSVQFQDVNCYSQPLLYDQKQLNLVINLNRGNGRFEVLEDQSKVIVGYIKMIEESSLYDDPNESSNKPDIRSDEIYKHLGNLGYSYSEDFQSIDSIDESMTSAQIVWNDNWVTFIDGLLQLNVLKSMHHGVSQPSRIRELTIDVVKHAEIVKQNVSASKSVLKAKVDELHDFTRCGGVLIQNLNFSNLPYFNQMPFELVATTSSAANTNIDVSPAVELTAERPYALQISNIGDLNTLHWEEATVIPKSGIEVQVEFAGINTSDVHRAVGVTPYEDLEKYYGMDFSGTAKHGERVMGLLRSGAASTVVKARPELLWPVPAHWTLEDAATVPLAYTQAFYYLCIRSRLQRGSTVLIHGGAGALGQAAISIALAYNCTVFTTVSDNNKKKFLLKLFPELNEDHIGNSRNEAFGDMILNITHGKRCDIVLSCVRDELKYVSQKCAGPFSFTVDVAHYIPNKDKSFGMDNLSDEKSYVTADFYSVLESEKTGDLKKLQGLVTEGIAHGYVRPLTRVTFAPHEAKRAFRLLAASRHRGRVLLRLKDSLAPATPRIFCSSESIYVIFWDGTSFGLELAERLIARGAKKIRIYGLNPTSKHLLKLRMWKKLSVDVNIEVLPNFNKDTLITSINNTACRGSIEGIFVSVTDRENKNQYLHVIKHLDEIAREFQVPLKHFAVISVGSSIGQQTCQSRAKEGLPAVALNLPSYEPNNLIDERVWIRSAVDVTEIALRSEHVALSARPKGFERPSILKLVPGISDIKNHDTPLIDLGFGGSLPSIQTFLKGVYHVSLDEDDVLKLTKRKLLEIERKSEEPKFDNVSGLRTFYSVKNHDELQSTAHLIPLNTSVVNVDTMTGGLDANKEYLFILPGLEGMHYRFQTMCARLKLPAIVLQPGFDRPYETPRDLALRHAKVLLEQFNLKKNFYLLGSEFGNVVALELATILEDNGLTGTIYCIGDGPDEMKALLKSELAWFDSEAALQEGVVRHIFSLLTSDEVASLDRALQLCSSWQERADACVRASLGRTPQTAQYIRALLEAAYARLSSSQRAVLPPRALRSQIVLMRAQRGRDNAGICSLQRYTQRPVIVCELAAPFAHAAADMRVPAIVNKYLDDEILQNYEKSNLCHSYVFIV